MTLFTQLSFYVLATTLFSSFTAIYLKNELTFDMTLIQLFSLQVTISQLYRSGKLVIEERAKATAR